MSPKLGLKLLALFLPANDRMAVLGDLEEAYAYRCVRDGRSIARWWLWSQVLRTLPLYMIQTIHWEGMMLRHYVVMALRSIRRHPVYSGINMIGLTIGMACSLVILLYVRHELAYDTFHDDADRMYRVSTTHIQNGRQEALTPGAWGPAFKAAFPEVEETVRFFWYEKSIAVEARETKKQFYESTFAWAEPSVLTFFSFPLIEVDSNTALNAPNTIVISERAATRYFPDQDPMGQVVRHMMDGIDFTVTGVMRDMPANAHFRFDFLASWDTLDQTRYGHYWKDTWGDPNMYLYVSTYIKLAPGTSPQAFTEKLPAFLESQAGDRGVIYEPFLQPVTDIHLRSHLERGELAVNSDITYVYAFGIIGILVLLVACINFVNVTTAFASKRAREVGIRKVLGGYGRQLVRQYLGESFVMVLIAFLMALVSLQVMVPVLNDFAGTMIALDTLFSWSFVLVALGIMGLVSLLAGMYPSIYLSSFQPLKVLKGRHGARATGSLLRKLLVVTQFAISIFLIIGTIVVFVQIEYIQTKSLGFDRSMILNMPLRGQGVTSAGYESLTERLRAHTQIQGVTGISQLIMRVPTYGSPFAIDGFPTDEPFFWTRYAVDFDFVDTYDVEIVAGRNFSSDIPTDRTAYLLNETAVRTLGLTPEEALGRTIDDMDVSDGRLRGRVVGIVQDFHFQSLHTPIQPLALRIEKRNYLFMSARINGHQIPETLAFIESVWQEIFPQVPFTYSFQNDLFNQQYQAEKKMGNVFTVFTGLAILIACMGLFGLASFTAEQRTQEIGIRKVLGASVASLIHLVSAEFIGLVLVANLLAWPLAYLVMDHWLQNFAYRADMGLMPFLIGGILGICIATGTVGLQAVRAALSNPVKTLRYE